MCCASKAVYVAADVAIKSMLLEGSRDASLRSSLCGFRKGNKAACAHIFLFISQEIICLLVFSMEEVNFA